MSSFALRQMFVKGLLIVARRNVFRDFHYSQVLRLKICDSHFTCKVADKCLNVRERVEVVEWNKRWSPPFPCCPVSYQCP